MSCEFENIFSLYTVLWNERSGQKLMKVMLEQQQRIAGQEF